MIINSIFLLFQVLINTYLEVRSVLSRESQGNQTQTA